MEEKIELSVIVPIYNCEKYLIQCIESILQQTYENFELILVDDGSNDSSGRICDEFVKYDNRVKVIHKSNEGCVAARRTGFKESIGNYVSFLDSDDWIESEFFESLMQFTNKAEIVFSGFTSEYNNGDSKKEQQYLQSGFYKNNRSEFLDKCLFTGKYFETGVFPALWCKIFKRDFIEKNIELINPFIKMGEDAALTFAAICDANSYYIDNENTMYHYRRLDSSLSTKFDPFYFDRLEELKKHFDKVFINYPSLQRQSDYYFANLIVYGINSELSALRNILYKDISTVLRKNWVINVFRNVQETIIDSQTKFIKKIVVKKLNWNFEYLIFRIKRKFHLIK